MNVVEQGPELPFAAIHPDDRCGPTTLLAPHESGHAPVFSICRALQSCKTIADHKVLFWSETGRRAMCQPRPDEWTGHVLNFAQQMENGSQSLPLGGFDVVSAVIRWIGAALLILMLFTLVNGAARAHGFHAADAVAPQSLSDGSSDTFGGEALTLASDPEAGDCGIVCCSPAHCAPGLPEVSKTADLAMATTGRFVVRTERGAGPFEQNPLHRPPIS